MRDKSKSKYFIKLYVLFTLITLSIVIAYNVEHNYYKNIWYLPVVFAICFCVYLYESIFVRPFIFRVIFLIVTFLRYCIQPLLMVITGQYQSIAAIYVPTKEQIDIAIIIMCYELIICTIGLYIFDLRKIKKFKKNIMNTPRRVILPRNKEIYYMFILFSFLLILVFPQTINQFTFLVPSGKELNIINESTSIFLEISIMFAIVAKYIIFILFISKFKERYIATNRKRYVYLAIIITLLNSVCYYGSNRSQFIFSVIASVITFCYLFPKNKIQLILPTLICGFIIFIYITQSRNYYDFYEGFSGIKKQLLDLDMTISSYFGGVNFVAIGIETANIFSENSTILNLLFDIIRPIVGVNLLVRGIDMKWSNTYFNYTVGMGKHSTMIFPAVGQGYFYFGLIGAPLLSLFMIYVATKLEDIILETNKIEYIFFFTLVLLRFGTLMGINITIMMNELSFQLLLSSLVIVINSKVILKNRGYINALK